MKTLRILSTTLALVLGAQAGQAATPAHAALSKTAKPKAAKKAKAESYTCPMHPDVHEHKPGRCPKCGMDLVKEKA